MMPTCLAPSSVQQKSQDFLPIGMTRNARSIWLVSIGTSGSVRKTSRPERALAHIVQCLNIRITRGEAFRTHGVNDYSTVRG